MYEPLLFCGDLWLSYEGDDSADEWCAEVTRFIVRDDEIAFHFKGNDQATGPFTGVGTGKRQIGNHYLGDGQFIYQGLLPLNSTMSCVVVVERSGETGSAEGQWVEGSKTYNLELDLRRINQPGAVVDSVPAYLIAETPLRAVVSNRAKQTATSSVTAKSHGTGGKKKQPKPKKRDSKPYNLRQRSKARKNKNTKTDKKRTKTKMQ